MPEITYSFISWDIKQLFLVIVIIAESVVKPLPLSCMMFSLYTVNIVMFWN